MTVTAPPVVPVRVTLMVALPPFSVTLKIGELNCRLAGPPTGNHAENSEVSTGVAGLVAVSSSVAVAVTSLPFGILVGNVTLKLALQRLAKL